MSFNCYLFLTGLRNVKSVPGKDHAIHVLAWEWGGSISVSVAPGAGGTSVGRAEAKRFTLSKRVDNATPWLAQQLFTGTMIPKGTLRVQSGEDKLAVDLLVLKMEEVYIAEIDVSDATGEASMQENVSLVMNQFEIASYGDDPAARKFGWDLARTVTWRPT